MEVDAENSQLVQVPRISVRGMLAINGKSVLNSLSTRFRETTIKMGKKSCKTLRLGRTGTKLYFLVLMGLELSGTHNNCFLAQDPYEIKPVSI